MLSDFSFRKPKNVRNQNEFEIKQNIQLHYKSLISLFFYSFFLNCHIFISVFQRIIDFKNQHISVLIAFINNLFKPRQQLINIQPNMNILFMSLIIFVGNYNRKYYFKPLLLNKLYNIHKYFIFFSWSCNCITGCSKRFEK